MNAFIPGCFPNCTYIACEEAGVNQFQNKCPCVVQYNISLQRQRLGDRGRERRQGLVKPMSQGKSVKASTMAVKGSTCLSFFWLSNSDDKTLAPLTLFKWFLFLDLLALPELVFGEPFVWYKLFQYAFELPVWTHGLIHFHFQEQNILGTQKCLKVTSHSLSINFFARACSKKCCWFVRPAVHLETDWEFNLKWNYVK